MSIQNVGKKLNEKISFGFRDIAKKRMKLRHLASSLRLRFPLPFSHPLIDRLETYGSCSPGHYGYNAKDRFQKK